jgi:hypothetical protein
MPCEAQNPEDSRSHDLQKKNRLQKRLQAIERSGRFKVQRLKQKTRGVAGKRTAFPADSILHKS